jgi:hypothetical protein
LSIEGEDIADQGLKITVRRISNEFSNSFVDLASDYATYVDILLMVIIGGWISYFTPSVF